MPVLYPTYQVGDTVQILSRQEVLPCPMDDFDYIIGLRPNGVVDRFRKDKLEICGRPAIITKITEINSDYLYKLAPLTPAENEPDFPWDNWYFSVNEFHPYTLPVFESALSFDDRLKGAAPQ